MWKILVSDEVASWMAGLKPKELMMFNRVIERLKVFGNQLRMPHSRPLKQGLYELRFSFESTEQRVTYTFLPERQAFLLTSFRKQRNNERSEVARAREVLRAFRRGNA